MRQQQLQQNGLSLARKMNGNKLCSDPAKARGKERRKICFCFNRAAATRHDERARLKHKRKNWLHYHRLNFASVSSEPTPTGQKWPPPPRRRLLLFPVFLLLFYLQFTLIQQATTSRGDRRVVQPEDRVVFWFSSSGVRSLANYEQNLLIIARRPIIHDDDDDAYRRKRRRLRRPACESGSQPTGRARICLSGQHFRC